MSSETYTYKGISAGKYVEGDIEALNQEEASFKLKEQKIIITNLVRSKKKKATKEKKEAVRILLTISNIVERLNLLLSIKLASAGKVIKTKLEGSLAKDVNLSKE